MDMANGTTRQKWGKSCHTCKVTPLWRNATYATKRQVNKVFIYSYVSEESKTHKQIT